MTPSEPLADLQTTVDRLLDPPGCDWNRAQTHRTLVTYLVEEAFELVEAIEDGTVDDLREELGDVLYQVVLHAGIAERAGEGFGLAEVAAEVDEKIRRRHPHVFGAERADGVDDIVRLWSAAKAREKADRASAYDGVPRGLPALARAQKIAERRSRAGHPLEPARAVDATAGSCGPGIDAGDPAGGVAGSARSELEWGHLLLAQVDRATARGWDAERALRTALREREDTWRAEERGGAARAGVDGTSAESASADGTSSESASAGSEGWRGTPQPE
jgi:XTP/dITP diphosphohydrolase